MYNWTFIGKSQKFVSTVKNWFANQRAWVNDNINKYHVTNHILWKYMELINAQYQGNQPFSTSPYAWHKMYIIFNHRII